MLNNFGNYVKSRPQQKNKFVSGFPFRLERNLMLMTKVLLDKALGFHLAVVIGTYLSW